MTDFTQREKILLFSALAELIRRDQPQPISGFRFNANHLAAEQLAKELDQAANPPEDG